MKLEVGMYCRYNNFQNKIKIAKIKGIQKANEVFQYDYINFDNDDGELETNIIKASYIIIDILEVGDYVNGKKIVDVGCLTNGPRKGTKAIDYYITPSAVSYLENEDIKSVITHEQMEQMEYKIKEND